MSIERYKMLTNSYAHIKHSSKLRIVIFIFLSWLLPLVSWLPVIIVSRKLTPDQKPGECSLPADKYLILALCFLVYFVPLICMVTFYTKLIVYIKKSSATNLESLENSPTIGGGGILTNRKQISLNRNIENSYYNSNGPHFYENDAQPAQNGMMVRQYSISSHNKSCTTEANKKHKASISNNYFYNLNYANEKSLSSEWLAKLEVILPCCCFGGIKKSPKASANFKQQSKLLLKKLGNTTGGGGGQASSKEVGLVRTFPNNNFNALAQQTRRNSSPHESHTNRNSMRKTSANNKSVVELSASVEQCHFTIHSKTPNHNNQNTSNNMNSSSSTNNNNNTNNHEPISANGLPHVNKEYSSETTSRDNINNIVNVSNNTNKRCSVATTFSSKKKDSAHFGIYENANYQTLRLKRNRKAARMLGILVAAFSICWLPFTILYPLSQFYPDLLPSYVTIVIWWMGYLNSTINPFLYVYSNKNIR